MLSGQWAGVAEAQRAIEGLGQAFSQPVLEDALRRLAKPIVDEIRGNLAGHRRTGLTEDDVRSAVSKEGREAGDAVVLVGARGGKGGRAFILRFLEFGTFRQPARPVLRPAWDAARSEYFTRALRELRSAYDRGVKRFGRRAA